MKQVDLIIDDIEVITMDGENRKLEKATVAIDKGYFVAIEAKAKIHSNYQGTERINGLGKTLFPGFINGHGHLFQNLLKGLGRDKKLLDWLNSSIKRALPYIEAEDVYIAALAGCMESMSSGVTTFLDYMYCHGTDLETLDDSIIKAFRKTGMRGMLGRAHTQVEGLGCPVEESEEEFFKQIHRLAPLLKNDPLVSLVLTPGIIWDHTLEGFKKCRELADQYDLMMTMHTLETDDDDRYSLDVFGATTMDFLDRIGVLGPDFICVHCIKTTEKDLYIMQKNDCKIIHCPVSNMILASGFMAFPEMLEAGLTIGIATDGAASNDSLNFLEVIKYTATIHKGYHQDATILPAEKVLKMATIEGAKAVGKEKEIGSIEVGKLADCFIFNPMASFMATPSYDSINSLVYHSSTENIETVIINGRKTLHQGQFIEETKGDIIKKLQDRGNSLYRKAQNNPLYK